MESCVRSYFDVELAHVCTLVVHRQRIFVHLIFVT